MNTTIGRIRELVRLERASTIERRVRAGEDPAHVVADEPDEDVLAVLLLRDEALEREGMQAEYRLARLAAKTSGDGAKDLRERADAIDAKLYRQIAHRYPQLARAVWELLGEVDHQAAPEWS